MEDTPNEVPMILWNRRKNEIQRKVHKGIELTNYGTEYYARFLRISESLIQLIQSTETKLKNGYPWSSWLPDYNTQYNLIDTELCTVQFNVDRVSSSCITIRYKNSSHKIQISLVLLDKNFEIMENKSFVGENMIILQEDTTFESDLVLQKELQSTYSNLQSTKYRSYMIYGNDTEVPEDLDNYEKVVTDLIIHFTKLGYIDL